MAEHIEPRRVLFSVLGVPYTVGAPLWQVVAPKLILGIVLAFITRSHESIVLQLVWGLIYGVLVLGVFLLHSVGHILASKLVQPPMTEARLTPIVIQTLYEQDGARLPARVHVIRSLGGPVMNLVLFVFALLLRPVLGDAAAFFAAANLLLAVIALLPLPTLDGEVIWREVERFLNQ